MTRAKKVGGHKRKFVHHALYFSEGVLQPLSHAYVFVGFEDISCTILEKVGGGQSNPTPRSHATACSYQEVGSLFLSVHEKVWEDIWPCTILFKLSNGTLYLQVCHTAYLQMLDWSCRWKIRADKVACESTCILY